ncbi:hypothetical protein ACFRMQ_11390 [Kitasatospora sp. NPDC056783]|uniref:hypothetical protein n=1 Tax=Kitasatospora sp. NPDC056783 TaxID=3345943 RepID=UPI0036CD6CD3
MQIQRTRHDRDFTVLPNAILQASGLSLAARGLLCLLLSQPDQTAETVGSLTEGTHEGQRRVTGALKELQVAGYVVCAKNQNEAGRWFTHVTVSDVPMTGPKIESPRSGEPRCRTAGSNPSGKDLGKNPTPTPVEAAEAAPAAEVEGGQEDDQDQATANAVAVLDRVGQVERRLRLGVPEMLRLAPLAVEWLSRGATEAEIRDALISGLPAKIRSASHVVEWRLTNKIPPVPVPSEPVVQLVECGQCRGPLPRGQEAGICSSCAGVARSQAPAPSAASGEAGGLLAVIRGRRESGHFAKGARPYGFLPDAA